MAALVERHGPLTLAGRRGGETKPDAFAALVRIVVAQQVSSPAARRIHERLIDAFDGRSPTPADALAGGERLRGAGLSGRKVEYVQGIARLVADGELDLEALAPLADEEVVARLGEIRGLGRWSGEMFLISHLERSDVLSSGDLGIRRGVQLAQGLAELPSPEAVARIAERWRPHRTLASLYLWREVSGEPPT
jgi:3-methyladenine DNA glycosylase/8-oxoguanine DNA glycosylase